MTTAIVVWGLTYLIHSSVLILLASLVSYRSRSSALKDVIWKVALVGGVFTASLQSIAPQIPAMRIEAPIANSAAAPAWVESVASQPLATLQQRTSASVSAAVDVAASASRISIVDVAVSVWLFGAIVLLARVLLARRRMMRMLEPTKLVADPEALSIIEDLRSTTNVRLITLVESPVPVSPFVSDRGEICVPTGFLVALSPEQKRAILAHEVGHLARRDPHWLVLSEVIKALFFFQPLNRFAQRQMRDASEFLCDDFAVVKTGTGRELAESLAGIAEAVRGSAVPLSAMAEGRSRLVERVARLLSDRTPEVSLKARFRVAIATSVAAMMLFLAPVVAAVDQAVPKSSKEVAVNQSSKSESALVAPVDIAATPAADVAMAVAGTPSSSTPGAAVAPRAALTAVATPEATGATTAPLPVGSDAPSASPAPLPPAPPIAAPALSASPALTPIAVAPNSTFDGAQSIEAPKADRRPGVEPKQAMAPTPVATPTGSRPVHLADATIAIVQFGGCGSTLRVEYDRQPARSRTAGTLPGTPAEGTAGTLQTWQNYSEPRPLEYAQVADTSFCTAANKAATTEYRAAFGKRSVELEHPRSTEESARMAELINAARAHGADYVLEGHIVGSKPVHGFRAGNMISVSIASRLIRVSDGQILDTRLDQAQGLAQSSVAYKTLARRLAKALKTSF